VQAVSLYCARLNRVCWLLFQHVKFLRLCDATQCVAPDRNEPMPICWTGCIDKSGREQNIALCRPAHCGDPAYFVDSRADHGEVQPVETANVAIKDLANMQAEIDLCQWQSGVSATQIELSDTSANSNGRI
jgi:hypothetical protein